LLNGGRADDETWKQLKAYHEGTKSHEDLRIMILYKERFVFFVALRAFVKKVLVAGPKDVLNRQTHIG
jgi:hypothetical protein